MNSQQLGAIREALTELQEEKVLDLVGKALAAGTPAPDILAACQSGMVAVGERFERQEYFVSDLMMSGEIFKQISALLEPGLQAEAVASAGKVVIGTVEGDIHDIGKDIVVSMLRSANMEVIDLGVDVPSRRFVEALRDSGGTVLGLSGLLTLAFDSMKDTVAAVDEAGLRGQVRIMIGGGPVNGEVCAMVGADDWGKDAQAAVRLAQQWLAHTNA